MITEELNQIFSSFSNKLVDISNYQSFIKSSTQRSLEFYHDQMEKSKEYNIESNSSFNSFMCRNIEDGTMVHLGYTENSFEDLIRTVQLHNNKQYQWLLVEAYEVFEDYIDELYAYMGYRDNTFWMAKDFGNVSIDELVDKDLEWFKNRVKEKQGTPESIYKQFRSKMGTLKLLEKNNPQNIDYDFLIVLISKLRHVVVHNRGVFNDINKFLESVLKDIGISMTGQTAQKYKDDSMFYIGEYDSENFVLLLEYKHKNGSKTFFTSYIDRLGHLIDSLASYAILLKSFCEKYLSENETLKKLVSDQDEYKKFFSSSDLYKHLR